MTKNAEVNNDIARVETLYRAEWDRSYPRDLERVWAAISDQDEVSAWMKYPTRIDMRVGGVIHIDFSAEGALEGIICSLDPPMLLIYTWGDSLVKWELNGTAQETRLHLSHIGVRPELLAGLGAGWHGFLDQLGDHLLGASHPSRYRELKARYDKELKAEPTERSAVL
ncbi:MAG: SRPBCC domain-containing protein [Acidobacteriaceae bacterium]